MAIRQDFVRLSLNPATGPHEKVYAVDAIRKDGTDLYYGPMLDALMNQGFVEYNIGGITTRRTAAGFDMYQKDRKPTLFVFAYDWRLDNAENARALADYVAGINKFYPGKKVNIVAHSMGGLFARRFIIDNPGKVNKLITIATPFLGSPKPLYQMLWGTTGISFQDWKQSALFTAEIKELLAYSPGVHQLMSPKTYFDVGGRPYATLRDILKDTQAGREVDYTTLMGPGGIIEDLFKGFPGSNPAKDNFDFHSYSSGGNSQDDWSRDTTGVAYFHLVGVQASKDTPQTLLDDTTMGYRSWGFSKVGPGDGTVPRLSAERITADGRNLNAPGAQITVYTLGDDRLLEHTGLMSNTDVQAKVLAILKAR